MPAFLSSPALLLPLRSAFCCVNRLSLPMSPQFRSLFWDTRSRRWHLDPSMYLERRLGEMGWRCLSLSVHGPASKILVTLRGQTLQPEEIKPSSLKAPVALLCYAMASQPLIYPVPGSSVPGSSACHLGCPRLNHMLWNVLPPHERIGADYYNPKLNKHHNKLLGLLCHLKLHCSLHFLNLCLKSKALPQSLM